MNKIFSFLGGVFVGILAGAAITLLMTPRTGESFRADIKQEIDTVLEEGRRAAETRRKELKAQLAQMRGEASSATEPDRQDTAV